MTTEEAPLPPHAPPPDLPPPDSGEIEWAGTVARKPPAPTMPERAAAASPGPA